MRETVIDITSFRISAENRHFTTIHIVCIRGSLYRWCRRKTRYTYSIDKSPNVPRIVKPIGGKNRELGLERKMERRG